MLRTLTDTEKADWKSSLAKMIHAYNCTRSEATGFSPYYLLYGRSPRLPIDLLFNIPPTEGQGSYAEYVENWQTRMKQAYEIASKTSAKGAARGKTGYDKRVHGADLHPGGRVLVRNLSERGGPGKLRSYWENRVHVVVKRRSSDSPVYEVEPEGGGKCRVLHRNLLLPCDSLPLNHPETDTEQKRVSPTQRRKRGQKTDKQTVYSDSENSDDGELVCHFPNHQQQSQRTVNLDPAAEPFVPEMDYREEESAPQDVGEDIVDNTPVEDGDDNASEPGDGLLESSEQPTSEEDEPASPTVSAYPQRERRRPRMLTYGTLGEPSVVEVGVANLHVSMSSAYERLWRPWTMPDIEVLN